MVWNFTGESQRVCMSARVGECVTDCQTVCVCCFFLSVCLCQSHAGISSEVSSRQTGANITVYGFCSRSELNACYYKLSCCHLLHTAGPCSLRSLDCIPTSLQPGKRFHPAAVCVEAKHHCSPTDISFPTMSLSSSPPK